MYNELRDEKIIIDLQVLFNTDENVEDSLNSYAEFMKERILSVSGQN